MSDKIYKLAGTGSGNATTNSVATVDIQEDCLIESIYISMITNGGTHTDGKYSKVEVSFGSTNTFTVNDVRQSLMILQCNTRLTTSGANAWQASQQVSFARGIKAQAGERVYVHTDSNLASGGVIFEVYLYTQLTGRAGRPVVRR